MSSEDDAKPPAPAPSDGGEPAAEAPHAKEVRTSPTLEAPPDPADASPKKTPESASGTSSASEKSPGAPSGDGKAFVGTPKPDPKAKKKWGWGKRIGCGIVIAVPLMGLGLWGAIHTFPGVGPWLANAGRAIFGNAFIAKLEDWAYGLQDDFNLATRGDEVPTAAWTVPEEPPKPPPTPEEAAKFKYPAFANKDVGPMINEKGKFAPGDGVWVDMVDPRNPDEPAPMQKTMIHPDKKRGWAQVAVVAMDLRQIELHLVPGTIEPATQLKEAREKKRTGVVAPDDLATVLAAFNGGFMTTHGNYGVKADGVVWVTPHGSACTIAQFPNDELLIRSWEELESRQADTLWFRQTPMCMVEQGELHKGLAIEENTYWGATLDKDTIIRRSGMGMSEDGHTLYVGIGEAMSAKSIATALQFAGAHNVAQLDVNFTYPKFVSIAPKSEGSTDLVLTPLVTTFKFEPDDYVKRPHPRDFFYVTRRSPDALKKGETKPATSP